MPLPPAGSLHRSFPASPRLWRAFPRRGQQLASRPPPCRARSTHQAGALPPASRARSGEPTGSIEERGPFERIVREPCCLREIAQCFSRGSEGLCAVAGSGERVAGFRLDLGCVLRVGKCRVGVEVVRGEDLGDLVFVGERPLRGMRPRRGGARDAPSSRASRRRRGARGPGGSRTGRARATWDRPARRGSPCARVTRGADRAPLPSLPPTAASPWRVNVLPRTAASWSKRRSSAGSPSRREATSPCNVSGTSSDGISPVGR